MFQKGEEITNWKNVGFVMFVETRDKMTKVDVNWPLISPPAKDDSITVSKEVFKIIDVSLAGRSIAVQPWW